MKDKTQIEKMVNGIELIEEIKGENLELIKEKRHNDWNAELEDAPYNPYYGTDIVCALTIMRGLERGLSIQDSMRMIRKQFKVDLERVKDLLYKYSNNGENFYNVSSNFEKLEYHKYRTAKIREYTMSLTPNKVNTKKDA